MRPTSALPTRFTPSTKRANVEIVNDRLRASVAAPLPETPAESAHPHMASAVSETEVWFADGPAQAQVYERDDLAPGATFDGPALVAQMDATTVVPPGWHALVDGHRNLVLTAGGGS